MKVKFSDPKNLTADIAHAGYRRKFIVDGDGTFTVNEEEWENHLARTGEFEVAAEIIAPISKPAKVKVVEAEEPKEVKE